MSEQDEQDLRDLEEQAGQRIAAAVEEAVARLGYAAAAIRSAVPAVLDVLRDAVRQALAVGARMAVGAAAALGRLRSLRSRRRTAASVLTGPAGRRVLQGRVIASRVDRIVTAAAATVRPMTPAEAEQEFGWIVARLTAVSVDAVNDAAAAGSEDMARQLGADGLIWVAERDACLTCLALSGHTVEVGEAFPADVTFADRPLDWWEYDGQPPRHPHCRCRATPFWGDPSLQVKALRREAVHSVLKGLSDSESTPAQLAAAQRLLLRRAGRTGLPKTVVADAQYAVAIGRFPRRPRRTTTGAGRRPT